MRRELPNLDWLRVFAAAAATENFALAAAQLGVTPGAVSQRIKSLEAFVGLRLFQRSAQAVRLTDTGKRYAQRIAPLLDQLTAATREVTHAEAAGPVRITILPALAQLWLGPRMADFHARHEGTSVEIWADATVVDLRSASFDLAIRYGRPPFPGCDYRGLLFDEVVPVASPAVADGAARDAHGLPVGQPLMRDTYWANDFDDWLQRTDTPPPQNPVFQNFSLYSMAVEAVVNGRGFMMGHTALIADLVDQGRLRYLSDRKVPATNQFYLLNRSAMPLSKNAQAFIDWIAEN